jgi:nicotinamide mononucleotide transporter
MSWIEAVGAVVSIVGVWLTIRASVWCWLMTIGGASIYTVVFFQEHLYASAALQIVYALLGLYGWYMWMTDIHTQTKDTATTDTLADTCSDSVQLRATAPQQPLVRSMPTLTLLGLLCGVITVSVLVSVALVRITQAEFAMADTCLSGISLLATWMTARKYAENWLLWIGADVCYVLLFGAKSLWLTVVLYAVLSVMAVMGYQQWMQYQRAASAAASLH